MTRRASPGFTLLEVLVALAVLGLLLGLLANGVHFGVRAWDTASRITRREGDLDAVDRALRRLITAMDPGSVSVPPTLAGTAARLLFTAKLPQGAGVPGLADLLLAVDDRHRLVLRATPHRHVRPLGPPPAVRQTVLLQDVARLEIRYWPRQPPFGWQTAWSGPALPGLVRIRIVFAAGHDRHWPDIVAAPLRAPLP